MTTTTLHRWETWTALRRLRRSVTAGAAAGAAASLAMALFAMVATATLKGSGWFTPLYYASSVLTSPDALKQSIESAMAGDSVVFVPGAAALGTLIWILVGVGYGVVFGVIVHWARLRREALIATAMIWAVAVSVISACITLPAAAVISGGGYLIRGMADMVGSRLFLLEHVIFGAVLGLLLLKPTSRG